MTKVEIIRTDNDTKWLQKHINKWLEKMESDPSSKFTLIDIKMSTSGYRKKVNSCPGLVIIVYDIEKVDPLVE